MPTYEYACASCGHQWEEIQRISADPLEKCPACAKATAKRQISGGSFILKGGGWYSDLYSSAKPAKKDSGDSGSGGGGSDGSSTGGGDTKSEPKAAKPEGSKPEGPKPEGSKPTGSSDGPKAEKKKPASGTAAA